MLYLQSFTFNPFQENTYVVYNDSKDCLIIDPGMSDAREAQILIEFITNLNLNPIKIINTHAHIDHILGIENVQNKYHIPFGIHSKELPVLNSAQQSAMLFGFQLHTLPKCDFFIKENESIFLGDEELLVRFTPGHSPGSVIFYYQKGNWVISGDVLFNGSIGRTDLPGGDFNQLEKSILTELYRLPDQTIVYSGHGPSTTIGKERVSNPFVQLSN